MSECVFCWIVAGTERADVLYEGDEVIAFLDRNPAVRGHTLVAPRAHREFLFAADEAVPTAVFRAVHRVTLALDRALDPDGVSVFYTSADLVGNVSHAHVHLLPRSVDDDIRLALSRGTLEPAGAERLVERVRAGLE